jgi:poly(A) polymerase/tRNA nucleotidyltransferase (CCA-adding enzyme)
MIEKELIPPEVLIVVEKLQNKGFEAYLVGGCVRDIIRGVKPKDWDVTTNAKPEEIQGLFEHAFYENNFGTVGIVNEETADETVKVVEVTTYRLEGEYSDKRRPDSVSFSSKLEDDLKRRDLTINAIAYDPTKGELVDLYKGHNDLKDKIIRTVGDAHDRFSEDALRMLRAVRLAAELGFTIDPDTEKSIKNNAFLLKEISRERIRDEFIRMLMSEEPDRAIRIAHKLGVLEYISKDFERGIGVKQNQAHKYDVFEHNLHTLEHASAKKWPLDIRLASLFHDISKPETRRWSEEKKDWTFYGHDVVGSRVTLKNLENLKFPNKTVEKVTNLVRWHMFFSDPDKVTLSGVRRIIKNIGQENIWDLMNLRVCDRIGTGRPKEQPYRLRKYKSMVEEALRDPISVTMLEIDGNDLIRAGVPVGPKIGYILHALLEEVLEDPTLNTKDFLTKKALELKELSDADLKKLGESGKMAKEETDEGEIKKIRSKHFVE